MQGTGFSFLDLTVMPFARKRVISANATLLFDSAFQSVLWANAAGTDLFASGHVIDLLEAQFSTKHPLVSQIKIAADQVHDGNEIVRNFRIAQGLRSITLQGAIERQILPDGSDAFLVVFEVADKNDRRQEHILAEAAVDALDGFADASAIVDEFGLPIASSDDFDSMDVLPSVIAQLVQDTASESDRMVKRTIQSENGKTIAAGIGRIHDIPSRYIVVLAELDEESQTDDNDFAEANTHTNQTDDIASPPWELENPNDVVEQDHEREVSGSVMSVEEPTHDEVKPGVEQETPASLLDRWYFKEGDEKPIEPKQSGAHIDAESQSSNEEANETPNEAVPVDNRQDKVEDADTDKPIRFAFTIGSDLIFNSVSPELQETVGNLSGDIIGTSWSEIATQYGFDETGSIKRLLEKADTWSGKSVLWPVEDTDMVMPVDLAALPVFDKDRQFDGFRGFGIVRTADAIVDVDARGMRLVELRNSDYQEPKIGGDELDEPDSWEEESSPKSDETNDNSHTLAWQTDIDNDKEPDIDSGHAIEDDEVPNSNIVSMDGRSFSSKDNSEGRLSKREQTAFNEIQKRLEADEVDSSSEHKQERAVLAQFDAPILVYNEEKTLFANAELLELSGYDSLEDLTQFGGVSGLLNDLSDDLDDVDSLKLKRKDGSSIQVYPILKRVDWEGVKALCLTFKTVKSIIEANESSEKKRAQNLPIEEHSALEMVRVSDLENILDTAADGILVLHNNGTIDALNSSGEALFGKSQADVIGTPFTTLFAKESQKTLQAYLDNLNDPNVSSILNDGREVIGIEANGGLIPMFASLGSIGNSGRYCLVLRDLTERKKSEEELVTAKRAAETASEQKSEFLARMSHEIREPLNAIIGFTDIMIEERFGPIQNGRYKDYLKDVNRSGIHVLDLVNDLLDISKIEAGKLDLSYEAVDLNQLAAETVALLQPQANKQRIIIRTSLSRAVPKVVADARSIRQIILNLASNAIRHSPPNSQVIVSTTFETNGEVGLRVRDTGDGMDADQLEKALEPFSQVKTPDMDKRGSTGLGLPLTKALIEANRAYFELESAPGEGTIAFVQFPSQRVLAD